jgi:hypothetical protein
MPRKIAPEVYGGLIRTLPFERDRTFIKIVASEKLSGVEKKAAIALPRPNGAEKSDIFTL